MTAIPQTPAAQVGEVRDIPLNRLKASPRNARRVGHSAEVIEARAASIKAKGVLQPLVVEPEIKDGKETGSYLVSIGEGRRQALRLLAKRKLLGKAAPVRCVVDTTNDPSEISLDENVSRERMHPADEFEAFKDLADRKGWGPEEIAARFGNVSPQTVRQRLRLGAVAPALLDLYREEGLTLDQVMAFAVNPDPERQMQVYARLNPHQRLPGVIRRAMTETKIAHDDKRALFVGVDTYVAAGGAFLVDLFTEAGEGWFEDVALLDRLVAEKLEGLAVELREQGGWKWSAAYLDYPHDHGCRRIFEGWQSPSAEQVEQRDALQAERDGLIDQYPDVDPLPEDVERRLFEIENQLGDLAGAYDFKPEEKVRAGAFLVLVSDGSVRVERGYIRPEDEAPPPEASADGAGDIFDEAEPDGADDDADPDERAAVEEEEPEGDAQAPLSPRISADLTAHRSAALRNALAGAPDLALTALTHALLLRVFRGVGAYASCLDVRMGSRNLASDGEGVEDSLAGRANAERHEAWAREVPDDPEAFWDFVVGLDLDSRMSLLAHCVSLTLDAVRGWENRPMVWKHADRLASALDLDMSDWWSPTAERYLDLVTKAQIVGAVSEVSPEHAGRLGGLKKTDMIEAARPVLTKGRWLPTILRTPGKALAWVQPVEADAHPIAAE